MSNNPSYSECIASSLKSVKDHVSQSEVSKNGQTKDPSALIQQSIPGFSAIRMTDENVTSDKDNSKTCLEINATTGGKAA